MGNTYYADGTLGTGANNGSSWADAWEGGAGLQTGLDTLVAGDVLYIRNTFTLAASLDVHQASGADGNPIRVVGCSAAGNVDGTRAVIDGDGVAAHCLSIDDRDWWVVENLEFDGATGDNVFVTATDDARGWCFIRCTSHDAGGDGWGGDSNFRYGVWVLCHAHDNAADGFSAFHSGSMHFACEATDNGGYGFYTGGNYTCMVACVAAGNSSRGWYPQGLACHALWCVIDSNLGDGAAILNGPALVAGCRVTDNGNAAGEYGLDVVTATVLDLWNFIAGNYSGEVHGDVVLPNIDGASTRLTSGADGYLDAAGRLMNLVPGAAGLRTAVTTVGGNVLAFARGLPQSILPRIQENG